MVICPSCRNENTEEAVTCGVCGTSLEPGVARFLPPRREPRERPPIEIPKAAQPSKVRTFMVLGGLGMLLVAAGLYWVGRPDPCRGTNFTSQDFGYCVLVPEGWEAGPARFGDQVTLDQFAPPTSAATVVVASVDLEAGTALEEFSEFIRGKDEDAGLRPGPASELSLDGTSALQWDIAVSGGADAYKMREIVTVKGDVGWRITLNDVEDGFSSSASDLREMLETWRFA